MIENCFWNSNKLIHGQIQEDNSEKNAEKADDLLALPTDDEDDRDGRQIYGYVDCFMNWYHFQL